MNGSKRLNNNPVALATHGDESCFVRPSLSPATEKLYGLRRFSAKAPWPITLNDLAYGHQLSVAGVSFPYRGPKRLPPWYAGHPGLPHNFEEPWDVNAEDATRIRILLGLRTPQADLLAGKIMRPEGRMPDPTLASACYCRWVRVRFIAGALANLPVTDCAQLRAISLVAPAFFVEAEKLNDDRFTAVKFKNRFRKQLTDVGLSTSEGFIIGGLHADFERDQGGRHTGYQFHYHLLYNVAMSPVIERLIERKCYQATEWVSRSSVKTPVYNLAGALTYLVKSFWTNRSRRNSEKCSSLVRDGSRLAPIQLFRCLSWFDQQRFADLVFTHKCIQPTYAKKDGW